MLNLTCLCGQIRIEIQNPPAYINACNCTLCRKSGAHWAYFHPAEVTIQGATTTWSRTDKPDPAADIQSCPNCESTTHFTLTASAVTRFGNTQMGVNMLLADERDLAGIELRYPDGAAWTGETDFTYDRQIGRAHV